MRSMTDEVLEVAVRGSMLQFLMAGIRPSSGCSATTFSQREKGFFLDLFHGPGDFLLLEGEGVMRSMTDEVLVLAI